MPKQPSTLAAAIDPIIRRAAAEIVALVHGTSRDVVAAAPSPIAAPTPKPARPGRATTPSSEADSKVPHATAANGSDHVELLLDAITAYPGLGSEQLREKVALTAVQVAAALGKLRAAQRVVVSGKARATVYTPIGVEPVRAAKPAEKKEPAGKHAPGKTAPAPAATPTTKRAWPTCTAPGCTNRCFPTSGRARLCYQHFVAAGGLPPLSKKK